MLLSLRSKLWRPNVARPAAVGAIAEEHDPTATGFSLVVLGGGAGSRKKIAPQIGWKKLAPEKVAEQPLSIAGIASPARVGAWGSLSAPMAFGTGNASATAASGSAYARTVTAKGIRNPTDEELIQILMVA